MSKLFLRSIFAATCLLLTAPVLCETVPAAPTAAAPATQILLQHTIPTEFLKTMHWDQDGTLPAGVSRVTAQPADNALSVVATPAGLAKVREIVAVIDIAPRQVEVKFALATATDARLDKAGIDLYLVPLGGSVKLDAAPQEAAQDLLQYGSGKSASSLLASLIKESALQQTLDVTTTNNTAATLRFPSVVAGKERGTATFQVTPRVNSDASVTLWLEITLPNLALKTIRTAHDGEARGAELFQCLQKTVQNSNPFKACRATISKNGP